MVTALTHSLLGYCCPWCLKLFTTVTLLKRHRECFHEGDFRCPLCEDILEDRDGYNNHRKTCKLECLVPNCAKKHKNKKACNIHYKQWVKSSK